MSSTLDCEVRYHALDQCQVLVNGRRVAYVLYGKDAKINHLPKKNTGLALTIEEKIAVAKFTREAMDKINAERDAKFRELAAYDIPIDDDLTFECQPVAAKVPVGASEVKGGKDTK